MYCSALQEKLDALFNCARWSNCQILTKGMLSSVTLIVRFMDLYNGIIEVSTYLLVLAADIKCNGQ